MVATSQSEQVEAKSGKASKERAENSRTYHSGGNGNTSLTKQDIEKLEELSRYEALEQVHEELANLLVLWKDLGGKIVGITLPEGKEILAHQHILVLPADKNEIGVYSLGIPK